MDYIGLIDNIALQEYFLSLILYKSTFLATHFLAVLQPSGYSIFHGRDTSI